MGLAMNSRLAFLAAGALLAWMAASWYHGERLASLKAEHATAIAAAHERHRATERGWQVAMDKVREDAQQAQDAITADLAGAHDELAGLREAAARAARRAARDTCTADGSAPAASAAVLPADLLGACAALYIDVAAEADRRRIAGQACEAAHDALRGAR